MLPQWQPQTEVSKELARSLIEAQFPELDPIRVERVGAGWDNAAFCVNGQHIFRFPQREFAAPLIEREAAILPVLAPELPLPIPIPTFLGRPARGYPWMFAGYDFLAGRTACSISLDDAARSRLAAPLANFLRRLHGIAPAKAIAKGLCHDTLGRMDHEKRFTATVQRLAELREAGIRGDDSLFLTAMERIAPITGEGKAVIVHGDLYARHVLICDDRLSGIIDWGDMHLGNPAIDLRIAFLMLPPIAHKAFREEYGFIDDRTWELSKYSAIYSAVLVLHYGHRINDPHLIAIGKTGLDYIGVSL